MACVVFSVDERLTGRPPSPTRSSPALLPTIPTLPIAFASIDPHRGDEGVREARRLVDAGSFAD
jgi:hypothetical protein